MLSAGASDPYCLVRCGAEEFRTRTIRDENHPEWEETFTFRHARLDEMLEVPNPNPNLYSNPNWMRFSRFGLSPTLPAWMPHTHASCTVDPRDPLACHAS